MPVNTKPLITPAKAPSDAPSSFKCRVSEQPDGGLQVHFLVEPDVARRLKLRANGVPLDRYLWEQILRRAVVDYCF